MSTVDLDVLMLIAGKFEQIQIAKRGFGARPTLRNPSKQ